MLKMALFDCAINEKCCSVDGGRSICPFFFRSHPGGFDSSRVPTPGNLSFKAKKKCQCPGISPGSWAQVELTGALQLNRILVPYGSKKMMRERIDLFVFSMVRTLN